MCSRRHGGGRVRSTTPAEDRYIVLSAKRNRRTTAQQVANQLLAASGKQISRKTVVRRLRGGGLYARRPVVCAPLTRQHRTARLQWCREHHNWTEQDWAYVLFSDESRFSLSSDCRRQLIWCESGTAYRPENIQEKDEYPTCSIMVWAGIMINGRTRLHVVANGTMTGQRYIDEVLLPHVRLFRGVVGDKFVFMDDNATCYRTLAVQDCLNSEGIQRLVWSARSPDLNPIENVWDALGRQVAGRNYPPTNKNTLIRALTEEWDKLPQQLLDNVVQSMPLINGHEKPLSPESCRRGQEFGIPGGNSSFPSVCRTPLHPEKLTVWCALWAGGIIGPYFFKNDEGHNVTVNGDRYRSMITNFFIPELNNHDVQELWFQQYGATCHTAHATIDLSKDTFGDRLISRFGLVNWPPRSGDLTPLDYFLWGYVKSLVYADKPQTLDHLKDNIRRVIADIRPQMLEKVIENCTSSLDCIRASRGNPMPEIIFKM
ncbi:transposable element Tcb2 transposase [Trichonephila clavipes]|nr:transposable element Tcb2 transposase [Trichonephila clavipes]